MRNRIGAVLGTLSLSGLFVFGVTFVLDSVALS